MELSCYVDDELPDYVMVMVANKRTRSQMEEDLLLFLGDNTLIFVNWLHHVLKKLHEVTVPTPPPIAPEPAEVKKTISSSKVSREKVKKEKKKDKHSKSSLKKSKKKSKSKSHGKRSERKTHKNKKKKKCKDKEVIRPNVPPLLMNIEKVSEPSITDVFAGQILKNRGIILSGKNSTHVVGKKPFVNEFKRPLCPIIDLSAITSSSKQPLNCDSKNVSKESPSSSTMLSRQEQLERMNATEVRLQDLRQKLVQQLESMSDDEDMLTLRAEAEELICDVRDELFQDEAAKSAVVPEQPSAAVSSLEATPQNVSTETITPMPLEAPEILPQIELKLPKWPAREKPKAVATEETIEKADVVDNVPVLTDNGRESEERLTPDKEPLQKAPKHSSEPSQHDDAKNKTKKIKNSVPDLSEDDKKLKKSTSESERASPASVVMVRPRPRTAASSSNLLMRAMADAQKSLLKVPAKVVPEQKVSALVLPIRRTRLSQNFNGHEANKGTGGIVIKVDCETKQRTNEEYVPLPITKKIINTNYTPTLKHDTDCLHDEAVELDPKDIHYRSANKEKGPIFVVTLDGLDPNMFLAKKLQSEGLMHNENEIIEVNEQLPDTTVIKKKVAGEDISEKSEKSDKSEKSEKFEKSNISSKSDNLEKCDRSERSDSTSSTNSSATSLNKKRLSDTSEDSDTQVILMSEESSKVAAAEKRFCDEEAEEKVVKKRKASPIIFDVEVRRAEPPTSVPAPTTLLISFNSSKYEVPPASASATPAIRTERKIVACSAFPLCRYGASCAFTHPPCKFATSCTRRGCVYAHPAASTVAPVMQSSTFIASHIVPAASYKSNSTTAGLPNVCKYFPNCANHACHFYHPKPCRYGRACVKKLDCNFYHYDSPATKWQNTM